MTGQLHKLIWACALLLALSSAAAQEAGWPRTLPVDRGLVTIYPLQAERQDGNIVRYRAALAFRPTADAEPVFGAAWFESTVDIDRGKRLVQPRNLLLLDTRFPEGTADLQVDLAAALAAQSPGWNLDYSLDQLDSELAASAAERESLQALNTAPPEIVYRDHPALLVTLDGDPVLRAIEGSDYQAVINTPYPVIFDGRHYYLNAMKGVWYRADRATGPYRFETKPPAAITAMVKPDEEANAAAPAEPVTAANAPEVVVATRPTELIVTDGPAVFVPLVDDLLVLQNSDDDVFMHVDTQQYYIVLAGRWYRAGSLKGPWAYQAADQLPPAFAEIPPESAQADSRVYVAGTPEAEEAVLEAQVPQTAAVARGPADVEVAYDGQPDFQPVDGTDLQYAANTGAAVLRADRQYYLVEDGVWYVADYPNGPWQVSAWRPQQVVRIAPTSPVYHVKYVYIYDYTPDVVYVGYTPGYVGSYVYRGTVVYGTGWYYRPWVSPYYYYPRPSTWGFHVGYNPWGGWSFGLSWNWGWGWGWSPYYASYWTGGYWHRPYHWHHRYYGYWGPRGYRPRPAPYYRGGYGHERYTHHGRMPYRGDYGRDHADYRGNYRGDRDDRGNGRGDRYIDGYRGRDGNLYRDDRQRARVVATRDNRVRAYPGAGVPGRTAARSGGYAYADRNPDRDQQRGGSRGDQRNGPSRSAPLTPDDLRLKAQVRDVNQAATRSMMVTDGQGKVYRKGERTQRLQSADKGGTSKTPPAQPPANRTQTAAQRPQPSTQRAQPPAGRTQRQEPVNTDRTARQTAVRSPGDRKVTSDSGERRPSQGRPYGEQSAPRQVTPNSNRADRQVRTASPATSTQQPSRGGVAGETRRPEQRLAQPTRQATPSPTRQVAPLPTRQAAPVPIRQAAPSPTRQAAPPPTRQAAPVPIRQAAPSPARQVAPPTRPSATSSPPPTQLAMQPPAATRSAPAPSRPDTGQRSTPRVDSGPKAQPQGGDNRQGGGKRRETGRDRRH